MQDNLVFLQDLADTDRTDVNDEYVENMAVLLQSLDVDNDAYNGIVITEAMREAFSDESFDLATISEADLISIIEENGHVELSEDAAMEHVQDMLVEYTDLENEDFTERLNDNIVYGSVTDDAINSYGKDNVIFFTDKSTSDVVTDFESNDILDLSDLLEDESSTVASLDQYLDFAIDNGDTLMSVDKDNDGIVDLTVRLEGVDLVTGAADDSEIIQKLLQDSQLKTDM
jgi:hypothetical protein